MPRSILLTGYPGFIAGRLVRVMLAEPDTTVRMLVLPSMLERAEADREALGALAERTELLVGDIAEADLGLSAETRRRLAAEVDTVYHLAAIYDLATPLAAARRVNVQGTERVLDLCEVLPRLERLVYFSTAYVSGTRTGLVLEDELEGPTAWKNHYESTKWEAELAVRRRWASVPTVIVRPGIVTGDAQTGATVKYDGPYFVIRALADLERAGRIGWARWLWSGDRTTRMYLEPVDFLIAATEHLARDPNARGKTYHVLPRRPITLGELTDVVFREFGQRPPPWMYPPRLGRAMYRVFPPLARVFQMPSEVFAYMGHDVEYDTRNLDATLADSGIECPPMTRCLPAMVRFVRSHERP